MVLIFELLFTQTIKGLFVSAQLNQLIHLIHLKKPFVSLFWVESVDFFQPALELVESVDFCQPFIRFIKFQP